MSAPAGPSKRGMRLALAAAALLVLVAGAAFYYASVASRSHTSAGDEVTVTIAGKVCDPNELTVPAGRRTFRIVNQSDRAVEWEILDGVMVVAERENIAPGISQTLTAKLVPGTYEITCGLLSNPRGTLTVTDSAEAAAEAARPPMTSFIGPMAQYQLDLALGAQAFVDATRAFTDAVKAGDLDQARQLYLPARIAYAKIEPTAARFGDLATAIDGQAEYFEKQEQDPGFKGFHRLEHALFAAGDPAAAAAAADTLLADATELQARIAKLQPAPEQPLLEPARAGRNRVYTARDRTRLKLTLRAKRLGLSLTEAREIVSATRYPPAGRRGAAFSMAHDDYEGGPVAEKIAAANERTLVIALVETVAGVAAVDEIAAVDGLIKPGMTAERLRSSKPPRHSGERRNLVHALYVRVETPASTGMTNRDRSVAAVSLTGFHHQAFGFARKIFEPRLIAAGTAQGQGVTAAVMSLSRRRVTSVRVHVPEERRENEPRPDDSEP